MGVNFYQVTNENLPMLGEVKHIHIGLLSRGWVFGWRAYPEQGIASIVSWGQRLKQAQGYSANPIVISDAGARYTAEEFLKLALNWERDENGNAVGKSFLDENPEYRPGASWKDPAGHDFSNYEFS